MTNDPPGYVEVFQDRSWFGDPKLAVFSVYVDKKRVGKVPLQSSVRFPVAPGQHRLRVRQWYYGSRPVEVTVAAGETLRYRADVPRGEGVRGAVRMAFNPAHCLVLERTSNVFRTVADPHGAAAEGPSIAEVQEPVR